MDVENEEEEGDFEDTLVSALLFVTVLLNVEVRLEVLLVRLFTDEGHVDCLDNGAVSVVAELGGGGAGAFVGFPRPSLTSVKIMPKDRFRSCPWWKTMARPDPVRCKEKQGWRSSDARSGIVPHRSRYQTPEELPAIEGTVYAIV